MSKSLHIAFLLVVADAFIGAGDPPRNLIENSSLEGNLGNNSLPKGWKTDSKPVNSCKVQVVKGGKASQKSVLMEGSGEFANVWTNRITIDPRKRYHARGWVKVEGDDKTQASLKLDYFDGDKWLGNTWVGTVAAGNKDWQPVTLSDQSAGFSGCTSLCVTMVLLRGKARFADLELTARDRRGAPGNLLINGNMEDVLGDLPAAWYMATCEGGEATFESTTEEPKEGLRCLHIKGNADWAVAGAEKVKIDKNKTYTLTGFSRAKAGTARVNINYWKGDKFLGDVESDAASDKWEQLKVVAEPDRYPEATHIQAIAMGAGEFEVWFDDLVLTAK